MANTIVMYKFWDTRNLYHPKWNWDLFEHNDGFFMESEAYHIELPENVVLAENKFGETCLFLVETVATFIFRKNLWQDVI